MKCFQSSWNMWNAISDVFCVTVFFIFFVVSFYHIFHLSCILLSLSCIIFFVSNIWSFLSPTLSFALFLIYSLFSFPSLFHSLPLSLLTTPPPPKQRHICMINECGCSIPHKLLPTGDLKFERDHLRKDPKEYKDVIGSTPPGGALLDLEDLDLGRERKGISMYVSNAPFPQCPILIGMLNAYLMLLIIRADSMCTHFCVS